MILMASNGHLDRESEKNQSKYIMDALLDTDTAADAQKFGDEGDFVGGLHLDTQFT